MKGKGIHMITFILVIIGGLNWLLFAVIKKDVGSFLPGGMEGIAATVVYVLVGLSAVYEIATHKKNCKVCGSGMMKSSSTGMSSNQSSSMGQ